MTPLPINILLAAIFVAFAVVFAAGGVMSQAVICLAMAAWGAFSEPFPPGRDD
ncbi:MULTISPECIES: hypothetical protein [unclassified Chelatococcus]|uniref:hypothetical protein n=1 Tax=unclassified Chelatococcus TaxID=2638111 RepID=UPI001BCDA5C1|nr:MULTISPECIES: hypothetical protein [unclassified Chelatococcus]MBS7696245.1 hypothetical protein [Chelatococcus sp. YT9]MBX3560073.1 hypothetical protein [Chelatococcus sp.]